MVRSLRHTLSLQSRRFIWHHRWTGGVVFSPIYLGVRVMDLRNTKRWAGRLLVSAGLAASAFLGTQGVAQAADASLSSEAVITTEAETPSTTQDPVWT
jgi:hypothetical protein